MKVKQLIRALEEYDKDAIVRIAFQENHPLKCDIFDINTVEDDEYEEDKGVVFMVADEAIGYTSRELWE